MKLYLCYCANCRNDEPNIIYFDKKYESNVMILRHL